MESALDQKDGVGRIAIQMRIGVTGHRTLDDPEGAAADVAIALDRILAGQTVHSTDTTRVELTIVSALAEGADRVIIDQARAVAPLRLEAVLPMPRNDYVNDFTSAESRGAYQALLDDAATVTEIQSSEHGYLRAGQAIVDRSDVMIALWDGKPARGSGGTAAIVAYARKRRTPLVWIHMDGTHRITTEWGDGQAMSPLPPLPMSAAAFAELDRFNRWTSPAASTGDRLLPVWLDSATARHLRTFVQWAAPYFQRADENASRSQFRSLAIVLALYALAPAAVVLVTLQVTFNLTTWLTWAEFGVLLGISTILLGLLTIRRLQWHDDWVAGRALAERIRSAVFLGAAGVDIRPDASAEGRAYATPGDEWRERAFKEIWLRRPQALVNREDFGTLQTLLSDAWIGEQINYHTKAAAKNARSHDLLRGASFVLFGISVIAALLHAWDPFAKGGLLNGVTFLAIAVPAIASAVTGYGAQREFAELADRSRRMEIRLLDTRARMSAADSLETMQTLAYTAEQQLRGETADWYALVHLHKPEVPV